MSSLFVCPTGSKVDLQSPIHIDGLVLHLHPDKPATLIYNQVKGCMFRQRLQNLVALLMHIHLSLQNSQVALGLCVMHDSSFGTNHLTKGQHGVSSGLPSA